MLWSDTPIQGVFHALAVSGVLAENPCAAKIPIHMSQEPAAPGTQPPKPRTSEEWQAAVDATDMALAVDSPMQYGLLDADGDFAVNADRYYGPPLRNNLRSLAFQAHHAEKNHHRHYAITVGCDLLDDWTGAICYGRAGQGGRELRYASPQPEAMKAVIRDRLRRRLSAPRRIGCAYRLAAFSTAPGFDAPDWLPGEVMARFFRPA